MKRKDIEHFIDEHLANVSSLQTLIIADSLTSKNIAELLSISANSRDKGKLKQLFFLQKRINLYKDFFISDALEEQNTKSSKDDSSRYRYKARFRFNSVLDFKKVKGYNLLQKYGFYNKISNPNGVVKDHRFSIAEGIRQNKDPYILGNLHNCEFLLYKDNILKRDRCSITYEELLRLCDT